MFFRFNRQFNTLKVDDSFARLTAIEADGDLQFEFTYGVSQLEAVRRNALKVNVSVISRTVQRRPLLGGAQLGQINTRNLISNILTQVHDAKTAVKEQENHLVAFRSSDISSRINNEIVGQLRSGVSKNMIPSLTKTKLVTRQVSELKEGNEEKPLLQFLAHSSIPIEDIDVMASASLELDVRAVMHRMILNDGLDPSYITQMTHRSIPALNALGGLVRTSRAFEVANSAASRLLNHHVLTNQANPARMFSGQVQDNVWIRVAESVTDDIIEIPVKIKIPAHARRVAGQDNSHFLVKFELIDGRTRATVDSVIKPLDVARHVQTFYIPRRAPTLKAGKSEVSSRVNLEIKQTDSGATGVQLYKKTINNSIVDIEDYVLIGTYPLTAKQQSLLVTVEKPVRSTVIYRAVPIGQLGNQGFEYSNVVVRPSRPSPLKSISINAKPSESGIEVELRQFPFNAVAVEVLVRNLTVHEKIYRNVGGIILIDEATRTADYVSVIDTSVAEGRVYEYTTRIIYEFGTSEVSGHSTLEFTKLKPGKVDLRIDNLEVINDADEPNVTFNMQSIILDENMDVVLALLKRQDIREYFNDDIAREREFLKGLIAHNVQRVELNSGQRENFGVITTNVFDDKELRNNSSVSPLKYGKKYRYEVMTLLRAPETLFEQFVKEKVDETTQKTYVFKPSKFLHPIALKTGMIVTANGLKTRFSKEPMAHGLVGTIETVEVSFDDQPARIINPSAAQFDRRLNVITWKLEGSIDQVDHFLIAKDVHGVRTLIGKAHSEFEFGNCQYLHPLTPRDDGELKYVIMPVFNDYRLGLPVITNSVIV